MVKDHSDSEKGNPLPCASLGCTRLCCIHEVLDFKKLGCCQFGVLLGLEGVCVCGGGGVEDILYSPTDRIVHTRAFVIIIYLFLICDGC